jgi:hypothetical protein
MRNRRYLPADAKERLFADSGEADLQRGRARSSLSPCRSTGASPMRRRDLVTTYLQLAKIAAFLTDGCLRDRQKADCRRRLVYCGTANILINYRGKNSSIRFYRFDLSLHYGSAPRNEQGRGSTPRRFAPRFSGASFSE